ncbi:TPA: hypothetical protein RZH67_001695, partial [Campylobacter coli]|nr:hypothetical protein [Campylobacter coli]
MSKEIQEFIEKIKDWENNFIVQNYDHTKYSCELANIAIWLKENNISALMNFWNEKIKGDYFELKHPIHNDVITRAVKSCIILDFNWVFFIDEENKHPFWLGQFDSFNLIITQNEILILRQHNPNFYIEIINKLKKYIEENCLELEYKSVPFGFTFQSSRPSHFFTHHLSIFFAIKHNKMVLSKFIFFKPKNAVLTERDDIVYFYPTIRANLFVGDMRNLVIQESLNDYHTLVGLDGVKQEYDLIIWLGLPGEKREWLEQADGSAEILKHFSKYFKKIKVYIDGMTAYDGERKGFPKNKVLFDKVVNTTRKLFLEEYNKNIVFTFEELQESINDSIANEGRFIVFKSLAGYDYRTKICYCNDCDIAIGDAGTTALVPFEFCAKSGVIIFGHPFEGQVARFHSFHQVKLISKDYLITKDINRWSMNYHIPPQHIYNLAAEVLEELSVAGKLKIKNLEMHRLEVPPVELIAKQYELEKQFEVKIPLENVEFVDKLATQLQQKDQIIQTKNQELESKTKELDSTKQQLDSKTKELSSLPIKKQNLEIKNLEQDVILKEVQIQEIKQGLINKRLQTKKLEKEIENEKNTLEGLQAKKQELEEKNVIIISKTKQLNQMQDLYNTLSKAMKEREAVIGSKLYFQTQYGTVKSRIQNQLSYKL